MTVDDAERLLKELDTCRAEVQRCQEASGSPDTPELFDAKYREAAALRNIETAVRAWAKRQHELPLADELPFEDELEREIMAIGRPLSETESAAVGKALAENLGRVAASAIANLTDKGRKVLQARFPGIIEDPKGDK